MAISFTGAHFPHDIILMGVRWYVAYPLIAFDFFLADMPPVTFLTTFDVEEDTIHAAPLVHGSSHQCTMRGHLGAETRAL